MKPYPFIQFITARLLESIERKIENQKITQRTSRYNRSKRVANTLFGMVPFAIHVEWKKRHQKLKRRKRIRS
ncbi:hypothetical protein [Alteribacillus sp. HJP-4]|uniref:hypothetical protein n=1 Tax=Alteribacillus sp. HJP-4 TaxID=2775394 RepID=UPI0035CD0C9E